MIIIIKAQAGNELSIILLKSSHAFKKPPQMIVHAIAHWSCMNTVRESALKDDWKKNPLPHW